MNPKLVADEVLEMVGGVRLRVFNDVRFREAIAVVGFPGMGLVGKTAVEYLVEKLNAKRMLSIYHYGFPAQLIVSGEGVADLMRIDVYYSYVNGNPLVLVTSNAQPLNDFHQNELSDIIAEELSKRGVKRLIAAAAFVVDMTSPSSSRRVFVAGSDGDVARFYIERGAVGLSEGAITGMNGVIVGWARLHGIDAVSMLGETWRVLVELELIDYRASAAIVEFLSRVHGLGVGVDELLEKGASIEREAATLYRRYMERMGIERREAKPGRESTYIT